MSNMDLFILVISSIFFYQFSMIRAYKREIKDKENIIKFKNGEIELLKHNLDTTSKKYYEIVNNKKCQKCINN